MYNVCSKYDEDMCPNVRLFSEEFVFVRDLEQIRTNTCRVPELHNQ